MTLLMNTSDPERLAVFDEVFGSVLPDIEVVRSDQPYDANAVRYIFTWQPLEDWSILPNLEIVFSVSAGVDQFAELPAHITLVKMVDPSNTKRVVEYVLAGCLACARDFPSYASLQGQRNWQPAAARRISDTHVLVLGLGEIGLAAARKLASVGFDVSGWSRTQRDLDGVTCVAGKTGYLSVLPSADIVVCLLPLTHETRGLLAQPFFAQMKHGSAIVHAGRGGQCVFPDLADALRSGQIGNAVLDVFETEPLPATDESWAMPNCLITPHVAGRTDARTAAENVSKNLLRLRAEEPLLWRVDRTAGY